MRIFFLSVMMLVILSLFSPVAMAADETQEEGGVAFDLSGYYRVRYDNTFNLGWRFNEEYEDGDDNENSDWWSYFDQRALLLPVIRVNENIVLKAQVDALRNVMFGQNTQATVPMAVVERNPADTEKIETVEFDAEKLDRGNVFSQSASANQSIEGDGAARGEVDPIQLTRLWAEVMLPIGFVRFGRMSSNFGMGIFSNSGLPKKTAFGYEGLDSNYGDTYDRLMFGTRVGKHYIPVVIYDRVVEGDFKTGDKDVHQYVFAQYLRDIEFGDRNAFNGGLYLMHRTQQSTNARIFAYDLWLKMEVGGFTIENEVVALQGSFNQIPTSTIDDLIESGLPTGEGGGKIEVDAYIDAFRANYKMKKWGAGVEYGFSSPSDPDPEREFDADAAAAIAVAATQKDADEDGSEASIEFINAVVENQAAFGKKVYSFYFDSDYDVDLIIWETLMGGRVENGMYGKVSGYLQPIEELRIQFDVINSYINESHKGMDGKDASHDLGWEVDVDVSSLAYGHFFTGVQFGYAFLGDYFSDMYDGSENIFTMQMRTGITF